MLSVGWHLPLLVSFERKVRGYAAAVAEGGLTRISLSFENVRCARVEIVAKWSIAEIALGRDMPPDP